MTNVGLDTSQYERSASKFELLPAGIYTFTITRVTQKENNDKTGIYEEVEFDIASPLQFVNRKFWDKSFTIKHIDTDKQKRGREAFSDLCKACGIYGVINDDQEILGRLVQARIVVRKSKNPNYPDPQNWVSKYYPEGANPEELDAAAKSGNKTALQAQAVPPKAKETKPWKR